MTNKLAMLIATWFYSGLIPPPRFLKGAAGTYGSIFSLPLVWVTLWLSNTLSSPQLYFLVLLLIYFIGWWSVPTAEEALGPQTDWKGKTKTRDQNQIVIDETLGMLVTFSFLSLTHRSIWSVLLILVIGLIFFRLFDIVKVWPTKYFDRQKTAHGVMLDDVMAGIYALICLQITISIFHL